MSSVYEPSGRPSLELRRVDDTYLLEDALAADLAIFAGRDALAVLEVGAGSGYLSEKLASWLGGKHALFFATDIGREASYRTQSMCPHTEVLQASLLDCFREGLLFDLIVFNPPYVPSCPSIPMNILRAPEQDIIDAAWAGGTKGRYWIDLLLPKLPVTTF